MGEYRKMEITSNQIHFFITYTVAFIAFQLLGFGFFGPYNRCSYHHFVYPRNYTTANSS